jgi:hypothetical protein
MISLRWSYDDIAPMELGWDFAPCGVRMMSLRWSWDGDFAPCGVMMISLRWS